MLTAGALLPWSGGAFRYVGETAGAGDKAPLPVRTVEPVIDPIGLFSAEEAGALRERVELARAETGARIVVMTTRGLRGESFDRFTNRFHAGWERGTGSNDAAIVFVSPADRLVGVSTGHGLPVRPTEAQRQAIIDAMKPLARAGDFKGAVLTGIKGVEDLLAKAGGPDVT
ncbi:TPM domain-containing protein [Croceicoccus sp. Ery15]|uniref:TPM domain-containing protein n=1 Tax=Croceicoccus sp. Ery15 TaxID=1703338 RepID=UPI001E29EBF3|nr:TPM domain-containing protein [Croceicoccus sp. Ery15]